MQTKYNLTKYEEMYKTFDKGHNQTHMNLVRNFAVKLAKIYTPDKIEIAYVSATLHDIGLSIARGEHEQHGYKLIKKDKEIEKTYGEQDFKLILEGIKEHRASSGEPQSIVAKIVSDSDKVSDTTENAFTRAYEYGLVIEPDFTHEQQLLRSAKHLTEKFTKNGTGTRVYFKESKIRLAETYEPIAKAYEKKDIQTLESFLEE